MRLSTFTLAAALAAAAPAALGAQTRLEVSPFMAYMPGFDMESELTVSGQGGSSEGSLHRDVDAGTAFGLRAEAGLGRHFGVYLGAAAGRTGDRHDNFWSFDGSPSAAFVDAPGYDVLLLSGGVSVRPVGPLFRVYAGPAVARLQEDDGDAVTHRAVQAGFAVTFNATPRVQVSVGAEEFVVMWNDDAIAHDFIAEVAPAATAESSSEPSYLPLIRVGFTFTL